MMFLIGNMRRKKSEKRKIGAPLAAVLSFMLLCCSYNTEAEAFADSVAHCHEITDAQKRLSCYDGLKAGDEDGHSEAVAVPIPFDMNSKTHAPQKMPVSMDVTESVKDKTEERGEDVPEPVNSAHAQEYMEKMAVVDSKAAEQETVEAPRAPEEEIKFIRLVDVPVDDVEEDVPDGVRDISENILNQEEEAGEEPLEQRSRFQTYSETDAREIPMLTAKAVEKPVQKAVAVAAAPKQKIAETAQISNPDMTGQKEEPVSCSPDVIEVAHDDDVAESIDMKRQIVELARQEEEEMDRLVEEIDEYVSEEEVFVQALVDDTPAMQGEKASVAVEEKDDEEEFFFESPGNLTKGRMAGRGKHLHQSASFAPRAPQAAMNSGMAVFQNAAYEEEAPASMLIDDWKLFREVNPIDDTDTLSLLREAEGHSEQWGDVPYLVLRCKSKQMDLYVVWHDPLRQNLEVVSRVGHETAEARRWSVSTDGRASFYPNNPISFIKRLKNAERFVIQATPVRKNPVTAIFDLSGLRDAVKPLQSTCHWR